jgi:hypothetical protein
MNTGLTPVITKEIARKITRGRDPLVPIEYEVAMRALTECTTLDESKYWSDKADALAAWAKIYHSDEAQRKAKLLKLHAYRRMGQLAGELRPTNSLGGRTGGSPGPISLLLEAGLKKQHAAAARKLSSLTERQFAGLLKHPVAPTTAAYNLLSTEPAWRDLAKFAMTLRAFCRSNTPAQVVRAMDPKRKATALELARDLIEWFDEFEQRLEKVNDGN